MKTRKCPIPGVRDHQGHLHPPTPAIPGIPATPDVWSICTSPGGVPRSTDHSAHTTEASHSQRLCPTKLSLLQAAKTPMTRARAFDSTLRGSSLLQTGRQIGKRPHVGVVILLKNQGKPGGSWAAADRQSMAAETLPFWIPKLRLAKKQPQQLEGDRRASFLSILYPPPADISLPQYPGKLSSHLTSGLQQMMRAVTVSRGKQPGG